MTDAAVLQTDAATASPRFRFRPAGMGALYAIASLAVVIGIWWLIVVLFHVSEFLLPSPGTVARSAWHFRSELGANALTTLWEVLLGFVLAIVLGLPLGVIMGYSRLIERALYPAMVIAQSIPKVAIAPLFLVWLGLGTSPRVAIAALIAFFPILVSTVQGLRGVPVEMHRLTQSLGASGWASFWRVRLPYALPALFSGLKVGMTFALIGAIVAEFVGGTGGLGYLIVVANGQLRTDLMFAAITVLSVLGVVLFYAVQYVESKALHWHVSERN